MSKKKMSGLILALVFVSAVAGAEERPFVEIISHLKKVDVSGIKLNNEVWETVKPYRQVLQKQFLEVPKPADVGVEEVLVQSITDGQYIAFRLTWKDATTDDGIKIMNFSDAAAIQFPVRKESLPEFFMGEETKPVHILYWKAWRSRDEKDGFQTVKTAYPNMTTDTYPLDYKIKGEGTEKTQAEKDTFIPGKAANNPLSFPTKEIIAELSSTGPGTLASKKTKNTSGDVEWKNDEWRVLFRRPLIVDDPDSVQFKAGEKMPIAFAVWEGSRMEAGGRKAVSPAWAEVMVEK